MPHSPLCFRSGHRTLVYKFNSPGFPLLPRWKPSVAATGPARTIESCTCTCFVSSTDASTHEHRTEISNRRRSVHDLTMAHAASSCFSGITVSDQAGSTALQTHDPLQWQSSWSTHLGSNHGAFHAVDKSFVRSLKALIWLAWRKVKYDAITKLLAAASVLPALLLAVQPLLEPTSGTHAADAAATAAASVDWQGPLRDMFSFTVLLSVFIGSEPGAAASAAVCAAGGAIALATGPSAPPAAAIATAVMLTAAAMIILLCAASVHSHSSNKVNRSSHVTGLQGQVLAVLNRASCSLGFELQGGDVLRSVQQVLGLLGAGLLNQFLCTAWRQGTSCSAAAAASEAWLPQVAAGTAAVILAGQLLAPYKRSKQVQDFCEDWPAWSATLLLILQPLQQLVVSSIKPLELLPACSPGEQLLLVSACGLMVPRALLLGELMWFTGTSSGAMLAAAQLVVLGVNKATCSDAVASTLVMVVTLLMITCLLKVGWGKIAQVPRAVTTTA